MRPLVFAVLALGAIGLAPSTASAADGIGDGCNYDYRGRLHCAPGATPGVPYGRGYRQDYRAYDDRRYEGRRHRRCRGGISIGGGSGRVCIRL
jgi:hypothetical protein